MSRRNATARPDDPVDDVSAEERSTSDGPAEDDDRVLTWISGHAAELARDDRGQVVAIGLGGGVLVHGRGLDAVLAEVKRRRLTHKVVLHRVPRDAPA